MTKPETPSTCDRREMLRSAGRGAALAAIVALTGGLAVRTLAAPQGDCGRAADCRRCAARSECAFPQARRTED